MNRGDFCPDGAPLENASVCTCTGSKPTSWYVAKWGVNVCLKHLCGIRCSVKISHTFGKKSKHVDKCQYEEQMHIHNMNTMLLTNHLQ